MLLLPLLLPPSMLLLPLLLPPSMGHCLPAGPSGATLLPLLLLLLLQPAWYRARCCCGCPAGEKGKGSVAAYVCFDASLGVVSLVPSGQGGR